MNILPFSAFLVLSNPRKVIFPLSGSQFPFVSNTAGAFQEGVLED